MGALTYIQKLELYKCHFLISEVIAFDHAKTPTGKPQHFDFDSPAFKTMLKNRMSCVKRLRSKGMTNEQIDQMISGYYKEKSDREPWDFLQAAGSPVAGSKKESDASIARRLTALAKIKDGLGNSYPGRVAVLNKPTPRNIPHPPGY